MRRPSLSVIIAARYAISMAVLLVMGAGIFRQLANLRDAVKQLPMSPEAANLQYLSDVTMTWLVIGVSLGAILIAGVFLPLAHVLISRPIARLATRMRALASGDCDTMIPFIARTDEIGTIARAMGRLRDAVQHNNALLADIAVRDDREAGLAREALVRREVEAFGAEIAEATTRLGEMTRRMSLMSDSMRGAAHRARQGSSLAKVASSEAASDVSSVAMASEQLLQAIEEIDRQIVQSANVVQRTVSDARGSADGMVRLSAAAKRVGDVVSSISRIAAQTNLLALNATIEAARAGEAGRGFAVVAQEVKNLATQTAKATQDIADQIAEMQAATDMSVAAIDTIRGKITEVEQITTIIASAVHEQGASTHEITRNVRSAASGAASMSTHVENVEAAIHDTGSNADAVVSLAQELDDLANRMHVRVDEFTSRLRAA